MKLKKVESICKEARRIVVLWGEGGQWLGDGSAFYPVYGLPILTENHIFTMFDIPEEKRGKFIFTESEMPTAYDFSDSSESEVLLRKEEITLIWNGIKLIPLKTSDGITFVPQRYLAPIEADEQEYVLCERTDANGRVYIVIKQGFLLVGVIMPYQIVNKDFVEQLKTLWEFSAVKLSDSEPVQRGLYEECEEDENPNIGGRL